METGIALAVASCLIGAVGLFWTIKSGITKVERDRLTWLEQEYPKRVAEVTSREERIAELNRELFDALRRASRDV